MNPSIWISIYTPLIIMIISHIQRKKQLLVLIQKRRKRGTLMSNEILLTCLNKTCTIYTGSLGKTYTKVVVISVVDNWLKIEKNGMQELINSDYIQNIKIYEK